MSRHLPYSLLLTTRISLVLAIVGCGPAAAATLTINGTVLPGTCVLDLPPVTLASIAAHQLVDGDNKLIDTTLNLTGCVGVRKAKLNFDGVAEENDAARWKNTAANDAAAGMSIALRSTGKAATYIKKGDVIEISIAGPGATYAMRAGYFKAKDAVLSSGVVSTSITVTANYE